VTPVRVGVVGARRTRMGLGPFVIRELRAAGAQVPGFVVRRAESLAEAERSLADAAAGPVRGHLTLQGLVEAEPLDGVAILSPHATHAAYLEQALERGLNVLCEKPLLWGTPDLASEARRLTGAFRERGLLLWENCQWPYTLPAFRSLHPDAASGPPRRFRMLLQPPGGGSEMLADCMPHPLSLLQALAPAREPGLADIQLHQGRNDDLHIGFRYRADPADVEVEVELKPTPSPPREIRLEIDGRRARRVVLPGDYRLAFADGGRQVPLPDPLARLVADFVLALERGDERAPERSREIATRMALLEQLVRAHQRVGP
jgi:predicted dehydrogenase